MALPVKRPTRNSSTCLTRAENTANSQVEEATLETIAYQRRKKQAGQSYLRPAGGRD